jgi:two-component system, OmpR family, KDP operon response regulator KdpE
VTIPGGFQMAFRFLPNSTESDPQSLIMIVENNSSTRNALRVALEAQGYGVLEAPNAQSALELLPVRPALIIVDLDLPNIRSEDLLGRLCGRGDGVPIVALSERASESSIVQALDLGADAYLVKPFGMNELLARMRNLLMRQLTVVREPKPLLRSGDLSLDLTRRLVRVGKKQVRLTPTEYELLRVLMQNAGKVLTHRFLFNELGKRSATVHDLRVFVRNLRRKIETDPKNPRLLLTEPWIGYRMLAPTPDNAASELWWEANGGTSTKYPLHSVAKWHSSEYADGISVGCMS